jgi:cyanate permease
MGLALMPLAAYLIITGWSWRVAWATLGIFTLVVGVLPALLLIARRPEDMGLVADPGPGTSADSSTPDEQRAGLNGSAEAEPAFTLRQALNTRAFWFLGFFSAGGFMVQAGVSLHQAAHYLQRGLSGSGASGSVSVFAFSQVPGGLIWSSLARWVPLHLLLALAGFTVAAGALATSISSTLPGALASAAALGVGVGGLHVLLRLAWADYYGRRYLGSIRGATLPVQIAGQALGPIIAGFVYDARGSYQLPFVLFAVVVSMASLLVLSATPPGYSSRRDPLRPGSPLSTS